MPVGIRIETHGDDAIIFGLDGLVDGFSDLTPLMEGYGLTLEGDVIERFDTETAPDGSGWTPSIRAKEDGGKTLTDSSQLRSSITSNASASSVEVGTNKIYAGVHQFGATIRAKTDRGLAFQLPGGLGFRRVMEVEIPARPFLGLSDFMTTELVAQAEDYARDAAGGAL